MAKESLYYVVGEFSRPEPTKRAIIKLRDEGYQDRLEYFSPFPEHHLEDEIYQGRWKSPVRFFTLLGGLTGCLGAFLFTSWMSCFNENKNRDLWPCILLVSSLKDPP